MPARSGGPQSLAELHEELFEVDPAYRVDKILGSGAYGLVLRAEDKQTGAKVALKRVHRSVLGDRGLCTRIFREMRLLAHFQSAQVLSLRKLVVAPRDERTGLCTMLYMVMELMETDLKELLDSRQALLREHVQHIMYQIVLGLRVIHAAGVVHRDLTPANVLINLSSVVVKIGDLGLAREIPEKDGKMTDYVTVRWYRAPEVILEVKRYTQAIDVWACGCIFGELLGSGPLFPGSSRTNQLERIFALTGTPGSAVLERIGVEEGTRKWCAERKRREPSQLNTVICSRADAESLDLVHKFLQLEPNERVALDTALLHPFLRPRGVGREFEHDLRHVRPFVVDLKELQSVRSISDCIVRFSEELVARKLLAERTEEQARAAASAAAAAAAVVASGTTQLRVRSSCAVQVSLRGGDAAADCVVIRGAVSAAAGGPLLSPDATLELSVRMSKDMSTLDALQAISARLQQRYRAEMTAEPPAPPPAFPRHDPPSRWHADASDKEGLQGAMAVYSPPREVSGDRTPPDFTPHVFSSAGRQPDDSSSTCSSSNAGQRGGLPNPSPKTAPPFRNPLSVLRGFGPDEMMQGAQVSVRDDTTAETESVSGQSGSGFAAPPGTPEMTRTVSDPFTQCTQRPFLPFTPSPPATGSRTQGRRATDARRRRPWAEDSSPTAVPQHKRTRSHGWLMDITRRQRSSDDVTPGMRLLRDSLLGLTPKPCVQSASKQSRQLRRWGRRRRAELPNVANGGGRPWPLDTALFFTDDGSPFTPTQPRPEPVSPAPPPIKLADLFDGVDPSMRSGMSECSSQPISPHEEGVHDFRLEPCVPEYGDSAPAPPCHRPPPSFPNDSPPCARAQPAAEADCSVLRLCGSVEVPPPVDWLLPTCGGSGEKRRAVAGISATGDSVALQLSGRRRIVAQTIEAELWGGPAVVFYPQRRRVAIPQDSAPAVLSKLAELATVAGLPRCRRLAAAARAAALSMQRDSTSLPPQERLRRSAMRDRALTMPVPVPGVQPPQFAPGEPGAPKRAGQQRSAPCVTVEAHRLTFVGGDGAGLRQSSLRGMTHGAAELVDRCRRAASCRVDYSVWLWWPGAGTNEPPPRARPRAEPSSNEPYGHAPAARRGSKGSRNGTVRRRSAQGCCTCCG